MRNTIKFKNACETVTENRSGRDTIGRLQEKTLHAVLKKYLVADESFHEIKIDKYFADAIQPETGEIFEVQTRSFDRLRDKLDFFLREHTVTVVYPIARNKWLIWIDEETGEIASKKRKSPKTGIPQDIFPELYKIKPYLTNSNIRIRIMLLDIIEYRLLNGWSDDKKKGSSRYERIPTGLAEEIEINCTDDYRKLLPQNLPDEFTSDDFRAALKHTSNKITQCGLNILHHTGIIIRTGKNGRRYTYRINTPGSDKKNEAHS